MSSWSVGKFVDLDAAYEDYTHGAIWRYGVAMISRLLKNICLVCRI